MTAPEGLSTTSERFRDFPENTRAAPATEGASRRITALIATITAVVTILDAEQVEALPSWSERPVPLLRPLLFDKLPADVKPHVAVMDRYWLTAEANSVYAQAAAIVSCEQHSPIMGIANGTPAVMVRQPTDTRKGQMWRDVGLDGWLFEIDRTTGEQIADCLIGIGKDLPAARVIAAKARESARHAMAAMIANIA